LPKCLGTKEDEPSKVQLLDPRWKQESSRQVALSNHRYYEEIRWNIYKSGREACKKIPTLNLEISTLGTQWQKYNDLLGTIQ
jgi:hypothetical protein